jgi:hypothetical protein
LDGKEKSKKSFFIVEGMQRLLPQKLRSEAPFALREKGVFLCEFLRIHGRMISAPTPAIAEYMQRETI